MAVVSSCKAHTQFLPACLPHRLPAALSPVKPWPCPLMQVLKKLRRLPWAESEPYLLKTLVRASYKGRFSQVRWASSQL